MEISLSKNHKLILSVSSGIIVSIIIYLAYFLYPDNVTVLFDHGTIGEMLAISTTLNKLVWIPLLSIAFSMVFISISDAKRREAIGEFVYKWRYLIGLSLLIILTAFNIHGSSIALWDDIIVSKIDDETTTLLWGVPRALRSDEYIRMTSKSLGLAPYDFNLRRMFFPEQWGYLFGRGVGLSWFWNFRFFVLFFLCFELMNEWTDGKRFISLCGGLIIVFSPSIQWWYSTSVLRIISGGLLIILGSIKFMGADNTKWLNKIGSIIMMVYGAYWIIVYIYPPTAVPVGLIVALLFTATLIEKRANFKKFNKVDWLLIGIGIAIVLATSALYIYRSMDSFRALLDSEYPGDKFWDGNAGMEYFSLFMASPYYFANELNILNSSEASQTLVLYPFVLIMSVYFIFKKGLKHKATLIGLFISIGFLVSYMLLDYPEVISKLTMMCYTLPGRLSPIIGVFMTLATVMLASKVEKVGRTEIMLGIAIAVITFGFYYYIKPPTTLFADISYMNKAVLCVILIASVSSLLIMLKRQNAAMLIIALFVVATGIYINPISKGVDSYYGKQIAPVIESISEAEEDADWIALDDWRLGNYLNAFDVNSLTATQENPNIDAWDELDPDGEYLHVYNRFVNIKLVLTEEETTFTLIQQDLMRVDLNIDDVDLLEAEYILSRYPITLKSDEVTFEEYFVDDAGIHIYRLLYEE